MLDIYSRSKDSVALVCRVPEGHLGVHFMLYRQTEKIQDGRYSAFSPYLQLDAQKGATPTRPTPVCPSSGFCPCSRPLEVVKRGDTLSFSCSVPVPLVQPQSQSSSDKKPVTFLLLRTAEGTGVTSVIPQAQAGIQVSNSEPQPGVFTVGPVSGGEQGEYTCLYQINRRRTLVNSSVSNMVQVTVTDALPLPTLVLQQQSDRLAFALHGVSCVPRRRVLPLPG
ncbi:hypothetical protein E3U43_008834 [Larimichthys crocea]|uniref:Uncharacterized protein n=1 Tax=Larimichthys crocea TaxID=215358 RepID=A0ACD3RXN8_LARCR|nr:hypothetical protein E3U43_008834 [Larimichthys crocea]